MDDEYVILEIEENMINCKKKVLSDHSDYFKVMFQGNFIESNRNRITLKEVDFKSLALIVMYLMNNNCEILDQDLTLVLETASMLQFTLVRHICIERLLERLSIRNCIKVWEASDSLDIKYLSVKAKNLSLTEFPVLKDTKDILNVRFPFLCKYLSNIYLNTKSELDVFATAMKWYRENSVKEGFFDHSPKPTQIFFYFLYCLDFYEITDTDIREIMAYPEFANDHEIMQTLQDIIHHRTSNIVELHENMRVNELLNCEKRRVKNIHPSLLVDSGHVCQSCRELYVNVSETGGSPRKCWSANIKTVIVLEPIKRQFIHVFNIPQEKLENLEGFQILGHKELLFLFGGEFFWGRGNWNECFWVFDTIRERWQRKAQLPFGRRHFESCIANDIIYIVGGTGSFRVLQDNMFWFNYKLDEWSPLVQLPCPGRQTKCCEYKKELFVINMNVRFGYIFNMETKSWITLQICDRNKLVSNFPEKFVVFSYEDFIYIKGSSIIKMQIVEEYLEVIDVKLLDLPYFDTLECVTCNELLYTLYKRLTGDYNAVVLESFNLKTYNVEEVYSYDKDLASVSVTRDIYTFPKSSRLFALSHHYLTDREGVLRDIPISK